jgi:hypothetical protein
MESFKPLISNESLIFNYAIQVQFVQCDITILLCSLFAEGMFSILRKKLSNNNTKGENI